MWNSLCVLCVLGALAGPPAAQQAGAAAQQAGADEQAAERRAAKAQAVIMWVGLGILSVLIVGIGLIWGVSRAARRILRRRDPAHTDMKNIWYLNPPEKRGDNDS